MNAFRDNVHSGSVNSVAWEKAVKSTHSYLVNVKNYLNDTSTEASRRLIIDPIVVVVTSFFKLSWDVEKRVDGIAGNGPLDYAINGMPILSVSDNENNNDSEANLTSTENGETSNEPDSAHDIHLESKVSNYLDDDSLAQLGMQLYDQYMQAVFGFLTTGQQWLCFSVSKAPNVGNMPVLKYLGMQRLRIFERDTRKKKLDDSGLGDDSEVKESGIDDVMCALAGCLAGST